jgi:hypothetical protein
MRWLVWCLTLVLVACGKSNSKLDAPPSGQAGKGGASAAGAGGAVSMTGGVAGSGEEAGAGASVGGRSSAGGSGGAPASGDGGSSAGAGGSGASSSGAGAGGAGLAGNASGGFSSAGDGSGGEAGGTNDECASYDACGCGCCGGLASTPTCYHPDRGEELSSIVAADQAQASDPGCSNAGCSSGTRHVCCAIPEPTAAAYAASFYIGGINHLTIERRGSDERCALLELVAPNSSPVPYSLEIPDGWFIQGGSASPCGADGRVSSPWLLAFGGIGSVSFSTPEMCAVDFDFTLFFASDSGALEAVRFQGQRLEIGGHQLAGCP